MILRKALQAIAIATVLSGAVQCISPQTVLGVIGGATDPATRHSFGIVGMFMVLFGGMMFEALRPAAPLRVPLLWAGLQKFGASAAVGLGVARGIFSPLALLVAGFDLLSGILAFLYLRVTAETPAPVEPPAAPAAPIVPALASTSLSDPKRSLVLAGGGMRVAWQAGVLRALDEEGITFHHADGTSGGTINLAMLLSGLTPRDMCERWRTLDPKGFGSTLPAEVYLRSPHLPSLGDSRGMREKVYPHLGIDIAKIRGSHGIEGTFNVCDFTTKTNVAVPHREIDVDLLIAGASLPLFSPAVRHGGHVYTDSVWIKDANLMEAVRRGAEEIWLVWCIGNTPVYKNGAFHQYVHMIEMSANGALFEEFDRIRDLNERIARGDSPYGQRQPVRLHVIKPQQALPLDPDYFFGCVSGDELIAGGYEAARQYLKSRTNQGIPWTTEATTMQEPVNGITFREKMYGGFALGVTDPVQGEAAGHAAGQTLTMHANITIDDIDRFVTDHTHLGGLTGTIDFPPLGQGIPAPRGVFNLFSPSEDPTLKLMVYELAFEHGGKSYYLAGRKEVRQDPILDLWKETTTLYTRLHEGTDKSGPVVGAGVLHLGMADLMHLTSTFTATGPGGAAEKAATVAKFGKMFMGNLWDQYVRPLGGKG